MDKQDYERLRMQTKCFILDLLEGISTGSSIDDIIKYIIRELGKYTGAEKTCVYEITADAERDDKVYKWEKEEDRYYVQFSKGLSNQKEAGSWSDDLLKGKVIIISDKASVNECADEELAIMQELNIRTLALIPVISQEKLIGCISMVNGDFENISIAVDAVSFLGKQLGAAYRLDRFNQRYMLFMESVSSGNLTEIVVDCETGRYEAFRIVKVLRDFIPEEGEWDWLRKYYSSIIKPEYAADALKRTELEYVRRFLISETSYFTVDVERDVNGTIHWFSLMFSPVYFDKDGKLQKFAMIVKDITQMKKEEEEYLQLINALSSIYKSTAVIDLRNRLSKPVGLSRIAGQFMPNESLPTDKILDIFCERMVQEDYIPIVREFMNLDTVEDRFAKSEILVCEYRGKWLEWGLVSLIPSERNEDGRIDKAILTIQDISEQKRREQKMEYKIEHDELTGVYNRTAFNRTVEYLGDATTPFALIILDIDKFKNINDTYGHDIGDEVLVALTTVLDDKMRGSDRIYRLGGDEFAIIMNRIKLNKSNVIKRIVDEINDITSSGMDNLPPFTISAGVTFSEKGYDDSIYHNADKALYLTKNTTRKGCRIFEEMKN